MREDRLHAPAHGPLHARRQHRDQHARRRRRQRRRRLRRARRADVRGQGPLGERRRRTRRSTTTSGTSRARTCWSPRSSASPTPTRRGFDLDDVGRRALRPPPALLGPRRAPRSSRRSTSARQAWCRSRCAGCTTPTPTRASSAPRCRARCGTSTAPTAPTAPSHVIEVDSVEQEGWPLPGVPGPDHRPGRLDGRPLPVLLQLAARRPAAIRHHRPRQPAADRPALARRRARAGRATAVAS